MGFSPKLEQKPARWVLGEVCRSPYERRLRFDTGLPHGAFDPDDHRPLTAVFNFEVYDLSGRKVYSPKIQLPDMVALTAEEIEEGFRARIHGIPSALVEEGRDLLKVEQEKLDMLRKQHRLASVPTPPPAPAKEEAVIVVLPNRYPQSRVA